MFVLTYPAFWGSNQQLQFGFVEPKGQKHDLLLMSAKLNGKLLTPEQLVSFAQAPFKIYPTYQYLLLDPATRVSIISRDGKLTDLGPLNPAIVRHWKAGWMCQVEWNDGPDVAVNCSYTGNGSVQDGLNSFRYILRAFDGKLLLASTDKGAEHERQLLGSELIQHAQRHFVSEKLAKD